LDWEKDMEVKGVVFARVEGLEISAEEHDTCVSGEWKNNFGDLGSEETDRYDPCRWIGDVDVRSRLGMAIREIGRQVIQLSGWSKTTVRPEVLREKKG
jgi:hypothetical protein